MAKKGIRSWHWGQIAICIGLAGASIWVLDLIAEYYILGWSSGFISPGKWWFQLTPDHAAAWTQAIGSILAIVAVVLIEWISTRARRIELERVAAEAEAERKRKQHSARILVKRTLEIVLVEWKAASVQIIFLQTAPTNAGAAKLVLRPEAADSVDRLFQHVQELDSIESGMLLDIAVNARTYRVGAERLLHALGTGLAHNVAQIAPDLQRASEAVDACLRQADKLVGRITRDTTQVIMVGSIGPTSSVP